MDAERFARGLPELFDDFPRSELPRDPRFAGILDRVDGLACANNLALLNLAASLVEPGRVLRRDRQLQGASLVAAMLGNEDREFVAIDSFALAGGSRELLEANLRSFGLEPPEILEGDVFELLDGGASTGVASAPATGTCSTPTSRSSRACALLEPYLVPGALVIVDDSDWPGVVERPRRLLRLPAARAAPRHDRGRPPRAAVVVGGNGRLRLGS